MIHLLRNQNIRDANPLLQSMFEDRKSIFIDLLDWDIPVVDDRFEMDEFDNEHALYMIAAADDCSTHMGSLRLLPSCRPHLLDTQFPHLCPGGVPKGPTVFEVTRLCLPQRLGAATRLEARNWLISAMVDHALAFGITLLTGVVEASFRKQILSMGWLAEPLGPACQFGGANLGAFAIHIAPDTPDRLRWTNIYSPNRIVGPVAETGA
ncbi:acyl-homoserine-lactone synthase [Sphingobium estronivorans]|uniref:acyl-homoserine-lactone synthase n=1 Tax=Sphingobium estronivorans TaxID=1577690 RepID=UPI001238B3CF|nr:acyl-homoserine-lactone synthase [Sphingobium estronivorans]